MPSSRFIHTYLGYLLGQANQALYKDFDVHVRAAGLSSMEWRVLATLLDSESLTVSDLAREVLAKQPTLTKLLARMQAQRWVVLQDDARDQRCTRVSATPEGVRVVRPLIAQARFHEDLILQSLDAPEKAALRKLLRKLAQPR